MINLVSLYVSYESTLEIDSLSVMSTCYTFFWTESIRELEGSVVLAAEV